MFKKVLAFFVSAVMATAMALPSMAAEKLATPTGLFWDGDSERKATWDEVDNATRYQVYLFRKTDSGFNTIVTETETKKTTINFSSKMNKEGDYFFRVRAISKSQAYTDSSWSADSDTTYAGPATKKVVESSKTPSSLAAGPGEPQPGWRQNEKGRWYALQADGSTWYANCWQWLDENQDGIAECYCFDGDGYVYAATTTPDGYTVNADGEWTVDGVVQTKSVD